MTKQLLLYIMAIVLVTTGTLYGTEKKFGEEITLEETTKISTLLEKPEAFLNKSVRVEGKIMDVCPRMGCWMKLAGDKESQTLRVKVKDGDMVFPLAAKGKTATAQGQLYKIELTKEQAIKWKKHLAEEKNQPFDPSSVTKGMTFYQLKPKGVVIK